MLPYAVEAGIDAREMWLYTIDELEMTISAYKRRMVTKAMFDYRLADLMGASINRLFDKNAKFPTFDQAYPNMDAHNEESKKQKELARQKAWLTLYASANNAKHTTEV